MALINTIEEVRAVLQISALNEVSSLPDFDNAGEIYIRPVLGDALYDSLQLSYDNQTLSPLQQKLLLKTQKALAAFGYVRQAGLLNVVLTDTGWRQMSTADLPAAYKWQYQDAIDALRNWAYDAQEELFRFLVKNKTSLNWNDSSRRKTLITNGLDFCLCYVLYQPLRTFFLMRPVMIKVEDLYINKSIGEEFFLFLKNKTSYTAEEVKLVEFLKMSIAHFTIKHAIESMPVRKDEQGFTVVNAAADKDSATNNRSNAPDELLQIEATAANRDGQQYLKNAKQLLNTMASPTVFPLFFNSPYYKPITTLRDSVNAGKKTFRF